MQINQIHAAVLISPRRFISLILLGNTLERQLIGSKDSKGNCLCITMMCDFDVQVLSTCLDARQQTLKHRVNTMSTHPSTNVPAIIITVFVLFSAQSAFFRNNLKLR